MTSIQHCEWYEMNNCHILFFLIDCFPLLKVVFALLNGVESTPDLSIIAQPGTDISVKKAISSSAEYLRDRIGVPRDMSYPAARQLRAHLNWLIDQL